MMGLFKHNSIRYRFTLTLAAVITLVMLLFSLGVIIYNSRSVEKGLQTQLEKLTAFSKESLSIALWQYNYTYIEEFIGSLFLYEDVVFASIIVKGNEVEKKVRPGVKGLEFFDFNASPKFISTESTIVYNDITVGTLQLVISRDRVRNLIISTSTLSIFILLLVNLAVFGTNYFLSNWYLFRPLSRLEGSVNAISSGLLDSPIDVSSNDEIGQLARSFEQMMLNLKHITASRNELNHEIHERKQAEKKIKAALKEKEVLFKEIHHRVKNNMQMIQSLLSLQSNEIKEVENRKPLIDSNNRIKSMALIHEILYRSEDMALVDIKTYFDGIVQHLFTIYHTPESDVKFTIDVAPLEMGMDRSIACGLIVNELVSNALKYAFIPGSKGCLLISLSRTTDETGLLIIQDNGQGLPDDLDLKTIDSLGLKIVKILVNGQLNGSLNLKNKNGARFEIYFPLSIETKKESF